MSATWKDFGHIIIIGQQLFAAILSLEAGGPATVEISHHGKKYDITISPQ